jgi:hypothetical protein
MTGYQSKKAAALDKLDDDDTQVYKDDGNALLIAYQSGYYDGKKAAQRPWIGLTDEELAELSASGLALWSLWRAIEAKLKEKNT